MRAYNGKIETLFEIVLRGPSLPGIFFHTATSREWAYIPISRHAMRYITYFFCNSPLIEVGNAVRADCYSIGV